MPHRTFGLYLNCRPGFPIPGPSNRVVPDPGSLTISPIPNPRAIAANQDLKVGPNSGSNNQCNNPFEAVATGQMYEAGLLGISSLEACIAMR